MQAWQNTYLGMRELPRDISGFELQAFFTFSPAERALIDERRGDAHKLGLALHVGFLRMSGRLLDAFRIVPPALWRYLGNELGVDAPELASLRALYGRGRTLFDHQHVACEALEFRWMSEHQRRALVRLLGDEVSRCADRDQLLVFARHWLYEHRLLIVHDRAIRTLIAAALVHLEAETAAQIRAEVQPGVLERWCQVVAQPHTTGQTRQSWLWAPPAKHSTRQISKVLERIDWLYGQEVHKSLGKLPDLLVRRYARRMASRPPSAGAKIKEPARTVEVACFLRYCLLSATDQLILMLQRRVADLWRQAGASLGDTVNWAELYQSLLGELAGLCAQGAIDLHVGLPDALDLGHQRLVASSASAALFRAATKGCVPSVSRRGNLQNLADRLNPVGVAVLVDEVPQDLSRRSSSAWAKNALASFRISLARRSSLFSRSSSFSRCWSVVVTPALAPVSTSLRSTHSFRVCATQPILSAMDSMAAHSEGYSPRCSCTMRTVSVQPFHLDSRRSVDEGVHLFRRWTPCRRGQGRQGAGTRMS